MAGRFRRRVSPTRCPRHSGSWGAITGFREPDGDCWDTTDVAAWRRACCAAADAFAEFGEGRVGGYQIGDFKVTNYMERGSTGCEVAAEAELAGTGLAFSGAGR